MLSEAEKFANQNVYADIDLERIAFERRRMSTFTVDTDCSGYTVTEFETVVEDLDLIRYFDKAPFVPSDIAERNSRCEEILDIQTYGLKKTSGAYKVQECRYRYFRRTGFHAGAACDGARI